jgi:isocitrate/isopropylmalate dehydrogenase
VANPIGAVWSAVLMLEHLGRASAADVTDGLVAQLR